MPAAHLSQYETHKHLSGLHPVEESRHLHLYAALGNVARASNQHIQWVDGEVPTVNNQFQALWFGAFEESFVSGPWGAAGTDLGDALEARRDGVKFRRAQVDMRCARVNGRDVLAVRTEPTGTDGDFFAVDQDLLQFDGPSAGMESAGGFGRAGLGVSGGDARTAFSRQDSGPLTWRPGERRHIGCPDVETPRRFDPGSACPS